MNPATFNSLIRQQQEWARRSGKPMRNPLYVDSFEDNFYRNSVNPSTLEDFGGGSGGELRPTADAPPKIQALFSSSALACNIFDYWRYKKPNPLTEALNLPRTLVDLSFEAKYPVGVRSAKSNLDVALRCEDGWIVGVESKFAEPFYKMGDLPKVQSAYLPSAKKSLWLTYDMVGCDTLANAYACNPKNHRVASHIDVRFQHLNVPQLLKHILGLQRLVPERFGLIYLWFDIGTDQCRKHQEEIEDFHLSSGLGSRFSALSYQQFIKALKHHASPADAPYFDYLRDRYSVG